MPLALREAVGEQNTVRNARQRIVVRHAFELILVFLEFGNVGEEGDVMAGFAIDVAHGGDAQLLGEDRSVLALVPQFAVPVAELDQVAPHPGIESGIVAAGLEQSHVLPKRFLARVTGDAAERVVDLDDATGGVGDDDAFVRVREHAGGQLEARFSGLALGDVGK